jgi:transcriptional regulator with XRE-family HTH domain
VGIRPRLKSARLAKKLLRIRKSLKLSQNQMLERIGMKDLLARQNISAYENGDLEPPLPVLLLYAEAAGICTDVLIDDRAKLPAKLPATPKHKP